MTLKQARAKANQFVRDFGAPIQIFRDTRDNKFTRRLGPFGCMSKEGFDEWDYHNYEAVEVVE